MDGTKGLTMCYDCIKLTCDITKDIPREGHINFCRNCERYLQPPNTWLMAQPESRELLALLLKRLKGLNKIRLVDAKFIWTEPHSRRIKIEIAVQGEAMPNVIVQQNFGVEYVVIATQCPDCAKSFTVHTWEACLQIRQKVPHKRTFFHLEQLILKHNAHMDTVTIKESRDGIDFFYSKKNHALRMLNFLQAVVPIKYAESRELISQDTHSGKKSYKFTFSIELVPICRDDLVILPLRIAQSLSNISQVVLCSKVTNSIQFIDPNTLQIADLPSNIYWQKPFASLSEAAQMIEFFVVDIEPLGPSRGKYALADCIVCRGSDMNETFTVRTHLGGILHPGDTALGYFSKSGNYNNEEWDATPDYSRPDVVLVKKHYTKRAKGNNRIWKLKRMAKEHNDQEAPLSQAEAARLELDYELFKQSIEDDDELQKEFLLYKNKEAVPKRDQMEDEDEEQAPTVDVDQLLDDLEGMTINDTY
ncbi:60S ribosomal export protein Nmd3p [Trichomonascus vanleenenianus]|uniref:ribosome-binding protein NMD3 n=1 Tax=Trichomonascus vanleenenianus TaxID=2268995 RepID=UPI003ECB3AC1